MAGALWCYSTPSPCSTVALSSSKVRETNPSSPATYNCENQQPYDQYLSKTKALQ